MSKQNNKKIIIEGQEIEVTNESYEIFNFCKTIAETSFLPIVTFDLFTKIFNFNFLKDISHYHQTDKVTRSNWTQNTANSFLRTCQIMDLNCEFEAVNRHDGVVRNVKGDVLLLAEWEYDTNSIFDAKGEIVKLANSVNKYKKSEAFLFTYKLEIDFKEFVEKVYKLWLANVKHKTSLHLVTAIMKKESKTNIYFVYGIRTVIIEENRIYLLDDIIDQSIKID